MKQALLIGCGNKRGSRIIDACHEAGYKVTNIGASQSKNASVKNIQINWKDLDLITLHKTLREIDHKIDFIFFNQNASSLSNIDFTQPKETLDTWGIVKSWGHSYWLSCQLPYFLIKTLETNLHSETIIGWMLSSFIDKDKEGVAEHPDYSGYKFTNYLIMKNFNNKYPSFGINPEFETKDKIQTLITDICNGKKKCNGEIF
jgi:hypothetical protein|tara:strand:- start:387 stop:992 length:606 start_codon:yes stop_codon:yes gene_type:complete